jgi:hypothetical protein
MTKAVRLADLLTSPKAPWVALQVAAAGARAAIKAPAGHVLRYVDGATCGTRSAVLDAFAAALDFPVDSGRNWDALAECLADLAWLPARGYAVVVCDAQRVLPGKPKDRGTLIAVLEQVGREWAARQTPFHVVFEASGRATRGPRGWGLPMVGP